MRIDLLSKAMVLVMATLPCLLFGGGAALVQDAHAFEIRVRGEGKLYADVQAAGITVQLSASLA